MKNEFERRAPGMARISSEPMIKATTKSDPKPLGLFFFNQELEKQTCKVIESTLRRTKDCGKWTQAKEISRAIARFVEGNGYIVTPR